MRSVCKSQSQSQSQLVYLGEAKTSAVFDFDFDFNILTAFIRLGRAGPDRGRVPSIFIGFVLSIIIGIVSF